MTSGAAESPPPRMVVVAYRPHPERIGDFLACLRDHVPILRSEGLATMQPPLVMRAASGAFVEIFEWQSDAAIERAHQNSAVAALWARFSACCDYVPLASLPEAQHPFSPFERVEAAVLGA